MSVRKEYQKELNELHEQIIAMGADVERAINQSSDALADYDVSLCREVIKGDDLIDQMERDINRECVLLIARQQPVASDLRDIMADLKLITDLERIADHAEDIAEHIINMVDSDECIAVPHDVIRLADLSRTMIKDAMDAYVTRSREKAETVIRCDDQVDDLYASAKDYLLRQMALDPEHIVGLVEMILICQHFERCADHAQNVAEWVLYYLDGRLDFDEVEGKERG